jgi:hypothetical protein
MTVEPRKRRGPLLWLAGSRRGRWIVASVILLQVLYVASTGPTLVLALRISARPGPDLEWPMKAWHAVYSPLESLLVPRRAAELFRAYAQSCLSIANYLFPRQPVITPQPPQTSTGSESDPAETPTLRSEPLPARQP